jgi:muramoyltetrapeptide carboxypeptidase
LAAGARIAVISPASPFREEELEQGLGELRAMGFEPAVDPRIFERQAYVSGPAALRAAVARAALEDPTVDALIGARGGYGSVQILPYLDPDLLRSARKPVIGYSDLTALLQFVTLGCGLVSFHGPTVAGRLSAGAAGYDRVSFLGLLTCAEPLGAMAPAGLDVIRPGSASGVLVGGTLTQLCASLGTPFAFDPPPGAVVFIEDVHERPYRIDRMLTQLRQAGVLARASALVFGEFPGCDEPGAAVSVREVVAQACAERRGPVLWGFPAGHTTGPAWTLPLGVRVRVVADPVAPALIVEEAAVAAGS